ncbi:MAG TPA: pteridine reductase [Steroidobacteraceae bacterium]|nr:pteridine reductase [Steroidobacteraceae bacterium]
MELPLRDKVVLITGAARRVGAVVARKLHAAGAQLVIHYHRSAAEAQALAAELNAGRPASVTPLGGNLLDLKVLDSLVEATIARHGHLDILINNASTFYPTPVGTITPAQWDDLMGTNLRAPLFLSQAAAPHLKMRQGLIINIADIHGLRPLRHHTVYSPAKAGLIMLTQSLARELAPEVRVNAIAPGPVEFPEQGLSEEMKQSIIDRTLLKRRGSPDDIARAALFFASEAPYVTGQVLAVDGGRSANA